MLKFEDKCIWLKRIQSFDAKWAKLVLQGKGEMWVGIRAGAKANRKVVKTRRRNKARYVEHLFWAILDLPLPLWWLWNPARPTWVE
jgi:hypothetical protein